MTPEWLHKAYSIGPPFLSVGADWLPSLYKSVLCYHLLDLIIGCVKAAVFPFCRFPKYLLLYSLTIPRCQCDVFLPTRRPYPSPDSLRFCSKHRFPSNIDFCARLHRTSTFSVAFSWFLAGLSRRIPQVDIFEPRSL